MKGSTYPKMALQSHLCAPVSLTLPAIMVKTTEDSLMEAKLDIKVTKDMPKDLSWIVSI